jgi:hypothetical protein
MRRQETRVQALIIFIGPVPFTDTFRPTRRELWVPSGTAPMNSFLGVPIMYAFGRSELTCDDEALGQRACRFGRDRHRERTAALRERRCHSWRKGRHERLSKVYSQFGLHPGLNFDRLELPVGEVGEGVGGSGAEEARHVPGSTGVCDGHGNHQPTDPKCLFEGLRYWGYRC